MTNINSNPMENDLHFKNMSRKGERPSGRRLFKYIPLSPFALEKYVFEKDSLSIVEIAAIEHRIAIDSLAKSQYDSLVEERDKVIA